MIVSHFSYASRFDPAFKHPNRISRKRGLRNGMRDNFYVNIDGALTIRRRRRRTEAESCRSFLSGPAHTSEESQVTVTVKTGSRR